MSPFTLDVLGLGSRCTSNDRTRHERAPILEHDGAGYRASSPDAIAEVRVDRLRRLRDDELVGEVTIFLCLARIG